jgi:hypothetical protein
MKTIFKIIALFAFLYFLYFLWTTFTGPLPDYYEYPADSAADCRDGELYDLENKVCYFDYFCVTSEECAERDKRYGQLLEAMAQEYSNSDKTQYNKAKDILNNYNSGPQINFNEDVKIKNIMTALLPAEHLERIRFIKKSSDGLGNTLAYVQAVSESGEVNETSIIDGSNWELVYDHEDCFTSDNLLNNPREFLSTFIHEYAHILTLNETQLDFKNRNKEEHFDCEAGIYKLLEGCLKKQSYLHEFISKFWTVENFKKANIAYEEGDLDFGYTLFEANKNNYITAYAATNPVEDFAETFAFFVLKNAPENMEHIKHKKIQSLYQYPELIELRNKMRGGVLAILRANKK